MTINLFFITLTFSVSKRKKSKEELEKDLEVERRMNQAKEKTFDHFYHM